MIINWHIRRPNSKFLRFVFATSYSYADKANERLRRRYYKMVLGKSKKPNVAKTAIARELACFMWGMMTDHVA